MDDGRDPAKRARARQASIRRLLRDVFGIEQLRDGQQRVIDSVLDGKDTLAVMPTGSGKSLCYQIPALMLPGATIVVSPLIALMKDQLQKVQEMGIPAAQVNSSLSRGEQQGAIEGIASKMDEIVFCTPERLAMPEFLEVLKKTHISLVVIDEAHCIAQWGHDFRPAYLELAAAIGALRRPPILALTATAQGDVVADIKSALDAPNMNVINTGVYRPNLRYRVIQATNVLEKHAQALRLVEDTGGAGIVYAATVKAAEEMHRILEEAGQSVALYHGRLRAQQRRDSQNLFMTGQRRVMVATNAFGMGIDKSDTRFVIHLQVPANLEAYYQESGRAGRDGEGADCTLLYFEGDKRVQQFFLVKHHLAPDELKAVYEGARALAATTPAISFAALRHALACMPADRLRIGLKLLKDDGLLRQNRKLDYLLTPAAPRADSFERLAHLAVHKDQRDRAALEQMVAYAQSGLCRWKLLLDYFGDSGPGFERCGACDNCLHPPQPQALPFDGAASAPPSALAAPFEVGALVRVPKFDRGTVRSVAGDQVTIEFPDHSTRTFLADYVAPA